MSPHCNIENLSMPCTILPLALKKIYFEAYAHKKEFIFKPFYKYISIYIYIYIYIYINIYKYIYIYIYIYIIQIVLEETRQYFSTCKTCFGLFIKPSSVEYRDIRICNNLTI